jgi:nicotinamidase/pyrazinamidase
VRRILWDVDTQVDFIHRDGKLSFAGADAALPAMSRLVAGVRRAGAVHVASADDHELTDDEISEQPDWQATFPPHCLRGTRGAERVAETKQLDPVPLGLTPVPPHWLRGREFLILKKHFDPFTNPNTTGLLELLDPEEIVLFGVATDICDDAAVNALLDRGRRVAFVEDAARALDQARAETCMSAWRARGVRFTTVDEVLEGLQGG